MSAAAARARPLRSVVDAGSGALVHGSLAVLIVLMGIAVGRPIYTDDLWWHLGLGEAFASSGPWLDADPMLFTAPGPPAPAAWLFDVGAFALLRVGGFTGLRIAHGIAVAGILALAWWLLRRASGSPRVASLATGAFIALSAYRLFQFRPHLFTIFATLLLYAIAVEPGKAPSAWRVAAAAGLCALWANVHASFVLGPGLLAAAAAGAALAAIRSSGSEVLGARARARRLAAAAALALLASLANPRGAAALAPYLSSGAATPELTRVSDEWLPFDPFRMPFPDSPPTPLAWLLVWLLAGLVAWIAWRAVRTGRNDPALATPDLALVAMAGASGVAMLTAVRFLWLGIFPLLLVASTARSRVAIAPPRPRQGRTALAGLLLVPAFVAAGDWKLISRGIPWQRSGYAEPYSTRKYYGHAVWFLQDAGVSGNAFNDYFMGGFLGFWLAPELREFVNGSLNVPPGLLDAYRALRERRGLAPGEDFAALLDRYRIDVFLGIGLPSVQSPNRPRFYTTSHFDDVEGWLPVFRNLRSGVYLRRNERNRENLRRIAAYYADAGVPFDGERGFDVDRVLREAPQWAVQHGVVPRGFADLAQARFSANPEQSIAAAQRLADLYAVLGLYERAVQLDRRTLAIDPERSGARRRLVWCLLHRGEGAAALEEAQKLEPVFDSDPLAARIAGTARAYAELEDASDRRALVAVLPLFTRHEASWAIRGYLAAPPRFRRASGSRGP